MNEETEKTRNELGLKIVELVAEYGDSFGPQGVAWLLIENAVSCSLACAPTELEGIKFILESFHMAIGLYEKNHS